ncbi:endonuclease/exonuclease/phosphatase family protein [Candidatus Daviesbacteria bacterium]|nr:endonuclease/exonuclease/phosphatase family protein [Candidatus Daviesbacteria bacterium]
MKLISLNAFGGTKFVALADFIDKQKDSTDIFCFQEIFDTPTDMKNSKGVRTNLYFEISKILKDFNGHFAPASKNHDLEGVVDFEVFFGLVTFVKKSLTVISQDTQMLFNKKFGSLGEAFKKLPKNIQMLKIRNDGKVCNIFNLHGQWYPETKLDTKKRLIQSKKIVSLINKSSGKKIICGDFNLEPNTKSIKIIEQSGLINLIKKFHVKATRVANFKKYGDIQYFADYIFVSKGVEVKNFKVPKVKISDHLPLILEFELA